MQKQEKTISKEDQEFSEKLLDLTTFKFAHKASIDFDTIIKANGPFVADSNTNVFYDLRLQSEKPFWGHQHPLIIKEELQNNTLSSNRSELCEKYKISHPHYFTFSNLELSVSKDKIYFQKGLAFYSGTSFLHPKLMQNKVVFVELYNDYFIKFENQKPIFSSEFEEKLFQYFELALFQGKRIQFIQETLLNIIKSTSRIKINGLHIRVKPKSLDNIKLFSDYGFYINSSNIIGDSVVLSLPTSFTKNQLSDCTLKLKKIFEEI